jgi:hypothetical protein
LPNAEGPEALGDLRRCNGASATILKPDLLATLRVRLDEAPPDGGLWSSRKVASWMAGELGLKSVAPQRGWEALRSAGRSRNHTHKNPKSATPEEAGAFKKSSRTLLPWRPRSTQASHGNRRLGPMAQSCAAAFLAGIGDPSEIVYNSRRYSR